MNLNLARTLACSVANGPGKRFVIWVQGCPFRCPGCWNPDTWDFSERSMREILDLLDEILETKGIEGVTFTGGEPFAQARALAELGTAVQDAGFSVVVFTGYDLNELTDAPQRALLAATDVLIAGRYVAAEHLHGVPWRSSRNQQIHFMTPRYSPKDIEDVPEVELHLSADGVIRVTGFPSSNLLDSLNATILFARQ